MSSKKHYWYLDIVRIIALISVLLYHLNILKGGYLAVCIFFVLTAYLSVISAKNKEQFSYKEYYKNQFKRLYIPLILVVFISIAVISLIPLINYLNLKPETTSAILGYNNFWQLHANLDYFTRHIDSPFMHLWYISILIQFDILFPLIYSLLIKIGDKFNKKIPIIILSTLTFISSVYFVISYYTNNIMYTYYNTLSRAFSLLFGLTLGFIHIYYKPLLSSKLKDKTSKIVFYIYIVILIFMFIFVDSNSFLMPYSMILVTLITLRLIDYSTLYEVPKFDKLIKFLTSISYEIYLVQYPIIFIFQSININIYYSIPLIILISFLIHFSLSIKEKQFKVLKYILLTLISLISVFGFYNYIISKDYTDEMKKLEEELKLNQEMIEKKNEEYELNKSKEEADWLNQLVDLENGENKLKEVVTNLNVVGVGDSVMLGAVKKLYETFPNGYFDAKISRTAWVVGDILKGLKNNNMLNEVIILNLGANGDCDMACKRDIIKICDDRKIFWINTTNYPNINERLNDLAKEYDNLYIIDWNNISKNHKEYFIADGIHLTDKGKEVYANTIYDEIYKVYLDEYNKKKQEIISNHENELNNKITFFGNDILVNSFNYLKEPFKNARFIINDKLDIDTVKEKIKEDKSLTKRIVFAFDSKFRVTKDDYLELINMCGDREIYILYVNKDSDFLLNFNYENVTIINFYEQIKIYDDFLMADRVHLTESGNKALSNLLNGVLNRTLQ